MLHPTPCIRNITPSNAETQPSLSLTYYLQRLLPACTPLLLQLPLYDDQGFRWFLTLLPALNNCVAAVACFATSFTDSAGAALISCICAVCCGRRATVTTAAPSTALPSLIWMRAVQRCRAAAGLGMPPPGAKL